MLVPMIRTFDAVEFAPATLVDAKGDQRISVCVPARDEASTIGPIIETIRRELIERVPLVDELLVLDDHSSDGTARVARAAGAEVVPADTVLARYTVTPGKGEALWKSLFASNGDLVVWCDADVRNFDPSFVIGLVGPLLTRPDVAFVKGFYERPLRDGRDGGGRVTELVARPALALLFPHLASVMQPLAGEYAARRTLLEQLPFASGYGVDIALLIDTAERFGVDVIAQVDLGVRVHRNRSLAELGPQATAVLHAVLRRATPEAVDRAPTLIRPGHRPMEVPAHDLPPLVEVPEYGLGRLDRTGSSELGA